MQALLTVVVTWLSINFGLPAIHEHPHVEFVSAAKMAEVRAMRVAEAADHGSWEAGPTSPAASGRNVYGIYDDQSRTIYLPEDWTGTSPAEVSVLVHELVHHVQSLSNLRYDCAGAREKLAYQAQARWLELFNKNLADEFGLDPMTILVRTNCMR